MGYLEQKIKYGLMLSISSRIKTMFKLFLLMSFFGIQAQSEDWVVMTVKTYQKIPNSCAKEVNYTIIFIKKTSNYTEIRNSILKKIKSEVKVSLYEQYYQFKSSNNDVLVITKITNVCNRYTKNETEWTGLFLCAAKNEKEAELGLTKYLGYTSGIKSHATFKKLALSSVIDTSSSEVIVYKSFYD